MSILVHICRVDTTTATAITITTIRIGVLDTIVVIVKRGKQRRFRGVDHVKPLLTVTAITMFTATIITNTTTIAVMWYINTVTTVTTLHPNGPTACIVLPTLRVVQLHGHL